jgi:hypothetical protein
MFFQHPSTINAEGTQPSTPKALINSRLIIRTSNRSFAISGLRAPLLPTPFRSPRPRLLPPAYSLPVSGHPPPASCLLSSGLRSPVSCLRISVFRSPVSFLLSPISCLTSLTVTVNGGGALILTEPSLPNLMDFQQQTEAPAPADRTTCHG